MGSSTIYSDAATELIEIFKFVEEPVLEKIPEKLKEELEKISNKEHKFKIDKTKKLEDQKMLPETKDLLSAIFIKYCCRKEDGEEILVACKENDMKIEREKRKKYNPEDVFKVRGKKESDIPTEVNSFKLVVIEKLPWYKKIFRGIKNFFKRRIKPPSFLYINLK